MTHDVLRKRLMRSIEALPDEQVYQVLDYLEFLAAKYGDETASSASPLQKIGEGIEDRLRRRSVNPGALREAFQLISVADKVISGVSAAGKRVLGELGQTEGGDADAGLGNRAGTGRRGSREGRRRAPPTDASGPSGPELRGRPGET